MKGLGCNCHRFVQPNQPKSFSEGDYTAGIIQASRQRKDKIVIQFWGRVKFRWNLNGAVFWWTQNKAELNVHRVKNWSHCRVDPESCCLGNYKVSIYVEHCVQKPLLWNSAPGLEIKLVSLCQGDLDPPGKSGCFVLQIYFKTAKFLMSMILDNKNSQWVRIQ